MADLYIWRSWGFVANPRAYTSPESCIVLLSFGILVNHRIRQNRKINRCSFQSLDVSLRLGRPPDAQTVPGQGQRPMHSKKLELSPGPGTTEITITGWQVLPQQIFAKPKSLFRIIQSIPRRRLNHSRGGLQWQVMNGCRR